MESNTGISLKGFHESFFCQLVCKVLVWFLLFQSFPFTTLSQGYYFEVYPEQIQEDLAWLKRLITPREAGAQTPPPLPGDLDGDCDVDRNDLNVILAARNQPATGPDDPRDLDGDGVITVLDARQEVLLCTLPRCAILASSCAVTNQAPTLNPIGDSTLSEGETLTLPVAATDPDGDPVSLAGASLPGFVQFTDNGDGTGRLVLSPDFTNAGIQNITLTATDINGASDTQTIVVTVLNVNRNPNISSTPGTAASEGTPYTYQALANDLDLDPIAFSLSTAPEGMSLDSLTGLISWTPAAIQVGLHSVTIAVGDGNGGIASQSYQIIVSAAADRTPPVVKLFAPSKVESAGTLQIAAEASDNIGVARLAFYVDGLLVKESTAPPHTLSYNAPEQIGAILGIRAVATDAAGNEGEATVSVTVEALPDTTAPLISGIHLPPSAAPGDQVMVRADASDDRGVAEVRFTFQGSPVGTDTTPPYEADFTLPADAAIDTQIIIDVEAVDTSGNQTASQGSLSVIATADISPPTAVTLEAPAEALAGQSITLKASAIDDIGILKVAFFADGVQITEDITAPYEAAYTFSETQATGSQVIFLAHAVDFSSNTTDAAPVSTRVIAPGQGFTVGEVYDDTRGLPIPDAHVRVITAGGKPLTPAIETSTDSRGRYRISLPEGAALLEIKKEGHTTSYRRVNLLPDALVTPLDVRLTPLGTSLPINHLAGGSLTLPLGNGEISLEIPAGAFEADLNLSATPLSGQGLPSPLPLGWRPLSGVHFGPDNLSPNLPLPLSLADDQTPGLIAVKWNNTHHRWQRIDLLSENGQLKMHLNTLGTLVLIQADTHPAAPPVPAVGEALQGVGPQAIPLGVTAEILPSPKILFMQPDALSEVSVILNTTQPLPSGTPIEVDFTERYNRIDGGIISPAQMRQDILIYQSPSGFKSHPVASPSEIFDPALLNEGLITLNAHRPEGADGSGIVGAAGGTVSSPDGFTFTLPPGALASNTPVTLNGLDQLDPGLEGDTRFNFLKGLKIDLGNALLSLGAALKVQLTAPIAADAQILAVWPVRVEGVTRYELIALASINGQTLTFGDGGTGLPLPGIRQSGRYYLIEMTTALAFITGKVQLGTVPAPSGLVSENTLPFISLTDATQPLYVLASTLGGTTVTGKGLTDGSTATADTTLITKGEIANLNLSLTASRPTVVSVTPADSATSVATTENVILRFSREMDAATINSNTLKITAGVTGVAGSATLLPDKLTAVFQPERPLADETVHTVSLASSVKDTFGNSIFGNQPDASFIASFTTIDTTPPPPPAAGQLNVSYTDQSTLSISATQGSTEPGVLVTATNVTTGAVVTVISGADGSFLLTINGTPDDEIKLSFGDSAGNTQTVLFERPVVLIDLVVDPMSMMFLSLDVKRTIQATATFSDGTVTELTAAQIEFLSSNALIASVDALGVVTPVAPGDAVINVSFGKAPFRQTIPVPVRVMTGGDIVFSEPVGPNGLEVELDDGFALSIPPGALQAPTTITVEKFPLAEPMVLDIDGVSQSVIGIYRFSPDIEFAQPVSMGLPIEASMQQLIGEEDDLLVLSGQSPALDDLFSADFSGEDDNDDPHQHFDFLNGIVRLGTDHFSYRVIMVVPPKDVKGSTSGTKLSTDGSKVPIRLLHYSQSNKCWIKPKGEPIKKVNIASKSLADRAIVLHTVNGSTKIDFTFNNFPNTWNGRKIKFETPNEEAFIWTGRTGKKSVGSVVKVVRRVTAGKIGISIGTSNPSFTLRISRDVVVGVDPNTGQNLIENRVHSIPFNVSDFLSLSGFTDTLTATGTNSVIVGSVLAGIRRFRGKFGNENTRILKSKGKCVTAQYHVKPDGTIYELFAPDKLASHAPPKSSLTTGIEIHHSGQKSELYAGPMIDGVIQLTDYLMNRADQNILVGERARRRPPETFATSYSPLNRSPINIIKTEPVVTHWEIDRDYNNKAPYPAGVRPRGGKACGTDFRRSDPCEPFPLEAVSAGLAYDFPGLIDTSGGDTLKINSVSADGLKNLSKNNPGNAGNVNISYGNRPSDPAPSDPADELHINRFLGIPGGKQKQVVEIIEVAEGKVCAIGEITGHEKESLDCPGFTGHIIPATLTSDGLSVKKINIGDFIIRGTVILPQATTLRVSGTFYLAPTGRILSLNNIATDDFALTHPDGTNLTILAAGPVILHGQIDLSGTDTIDTQPGRGGDFTVNSRAGSPLQIPTIIAQGGDVGTYDKIWNPLAEKFEGHELGTGGTGGKVEIKQLANGLIVFSGLKTLPPFVQSVPNAKIPCNYPSTLTGPVGLFFPITTIPQAGMTGIKAWQYESSFFESTVSGETGMVNRCDALGTSGGRHGLGLTLGRGIVTSGGMGASVQFGQGQVTNPLQGSSGGNGGNIHIGFQGRSTGVIRFRGVSLITGGGTGTFKTQVPIAFFLRRKSVLTKLFQLGGSAGGKGSTAKAGAMNLREGVPLCADGPSDPANNPPSPFSSPEPQISCSRTAGAFTLNAQDGGNGGSGGRAGDIIIDENASIFPAPNHECGKKRDLYGHDGGFPIKEPVSVIGGIHTICGKVGPNDLDMLTLYLKKESFLPAGRPYAVIGGSGGLAGGSPRNTRANIARFSHLGTAGEFGSIGGNGILSMPGQLWGVLNGVNIPPVDPVITVDAGDTTGNIGAVQSIEVRSGSRTGSGGLLEVVPPSSGSIIDLTAILSPGSVPSASGPSWEINGPSSTTAANGSSTSFTADNWISNVFFMGSLIPETYTISSEGKIATVKAYSDKVSKLTISAGEFGPAVNTIKKWEKVLDKVGATTFFALNLTPPTGSFSFENKWAERLDSHLAQYVWTLGANSTTGISAKFRLPSALAGVPPFLIDAAVFVELAGSLGVNGSASLSSQGQFIAQGGFEGSIAIGVGGEASAVEGLLAVVTKGASALTLKGALFGEPNPAQVGSDVKVEVEGLTVSYQIEAIFGIFNHTDSYEVFAPSQIYPATGSSGKVVLVPGPFGS